MPKGKLLATGQMEEKLKCGTKGQFDGGKQERLRRGS